ncbi:MAG: glycosyltransferase family 4 protein [Chloroflexota bacterium]
MKARVGIDATFLERDGRYTGMGVYTRGIATGLAEVAEGDEIVLLGYGPRPADLPEAIGWERMARLPAGRASLWASHQIVLPRIARRLNLDLVHVPGVNLRLSQPGVPFWLPCPLVVTVHDAIPVSYYGVVGPALPWRLRVGYQVALLAVRRASVVFTVSETSRRDILAHLRIQSARLRVVYNGLETPGAANEGRDRATLARLGVFPPYLLYAGSFEPRKNLLGAVFAYRDALKRRALPDLVLLVERESGHRAAVLAEVTASGIDHGLRFVHSLSDDELTTLYRHASIFLAPSRSEGFGFAPLQALALGVPVIAARAGALPEVLGDAARYVDPTSVEEWATAIVELVDQPAWAAELGARGPARAACFRWSTAACQILDEYRRIAARRPRPAAPPIRR